MVEKADKLVWDLTGTFAELAADSLRVWGMSYLFSL